MTSGDSDEDLPPGDSESSLVNEGIGLMLRDLDLCFLVAVAEMDPC